MSYQGKVVWVTGASSGIGEALANALLHSGAQVILSGRRVGELERVAAAAPDRALVLPFETTDYDALPQVVEQAWAWRGRIDVLINNAGVSQRSLALDTRLEVYRQLIEVDYLAPLALTQLVVPRMVERRTGHIAVISSVAGKVGTPLRSGYCGAKHAVVGYFDALRGEIEQAYGIRVSVILPGSVQTSVAVNALVGDGSSRGRSDANIENGMPVATAAKIILDGMAEGKREIPVAEGKELAALHLRTQDPERLFDMLAKEGARLATLREEGRSIDPSDIRSER
ncbi:SDR family NAD(P)-dependent oxidoreductase [Undibacterium sp.]|uniref:SDR family NAD(P)-dependent oxidoreductase n=1 Tax=Undibacterium sp. TaxID=1914977 RepID=UPI002BD416F3|nr:SDR family NAD(P)-dependent oxidoreductase [Undibacterium sp.]HTD02738.1 SDR family NAD(P)-dependent oxidoreductase [Undibacterium sp.]